MNAMLWLVFMLMVVMVVMVIMLRGLLAHPALEEEDYTVTTVTTTDRSGFKVVGELNRQGEDGQYFVLDPVDGLKVFINSQDDMYEDANGAIWRVV